MTQHTGIPANHGEDACATRQGSNAERAIATNGVGQVTNANNAERAINTSRGGRPIDTARIERAVVELIAAIGEDIEREGLQKTPERVARMYAEILSGYAEDPRSHLSAVFVDDGHEEMVIVKDISFSSTCEHHLLPFVGRVHIAYIPAGGRIVGLSKLARVVEGYSRRLQLQERLTSQIADTLVEELRPRGALVIVDAEHMCMSIRGVKKPGAKTVTSAVRGIFKTNASSREEALGLIRLSG